MKVKEIRELSTEDIQAKIKENIMALYEEVLKRRPADLKGEYVDTFYISATMSPAVKINTKSMAV